nr:hypothetical protein [Candidatus Sigynarchaeota archaeon]
MNESPGITVKNSILTSRGGFSFELFSGTGWNISAVELEDHGFLARFDPRVITIIAPGVFFVRRTEQRLVFSGIINTSLDAGKEEHSLNVTVYLAPLQDFGSTVEEPQAKKQKIKITFKSPFKIILFKTEARLILPIFKNVYEKMERLLAKRDNELLEEDRRMMDQFSLFEYVIENQSDMKLNNVKVTFTLAIPDSDGSQKALGFHERSGLLFLPGEKLALSSSMHFYRNMLELPQETNATVLLEIDGFPVEQAIQVKIGGHDQMAWHSSAISARAKDIAGAMNITKCDLLGYYYLWVARVPGHLFTSNKPGYKAVHDGFMTFMKAVNENNKGGDPRRLLAGIARALKA